MEVMLNLKARVGSVYLVDVVREASLPSEIVWEAVINWMALKCVSVTIELEDFLDEQ